MNRTDVSWTCPAPAARTHAVCFGHHYNLSWRSCSHFTGEQWRITETKHHWAHEDERQNAVWSAGLHASVLSTLSEKVPCCPPQLSSKLLFSFPATATQLQLAVIQPEKSLLIHISNIFFALHHHHYHHHYHHEQKSHHPHHHYHHHHHHHHHDHHHHSQHNQYRHLPFIEWTPWSTHCGSDVDLGLGTNKPLTHIHSLNPQNNPAWCISFHISTLWTRKLKLEEVKALAPGHSSGRIWVQNASFLLPRHLIHATPNWLNSTPGSSAEQFHEIIKQMFLLY